MRTAWVFLSCLLGLLMAPQQAYSKPDPRIQLDTMSIRKAYIDGDFEQAIEDIERVIRRGYILSHAESVFVFKHLGVMYAAKYETREKGKHYMMQLLNVEPTAKILDMYASDMIYMIFKNIQNEFEAGQGRLVADNADSIRASPRKTAAETKPKRSRAWIGWTAGALVAVGGAAVAYQLLEENEPRERVIE